MAALSGEGEEWFFAVKRNETKMQGEKFLEAVGQVDVSPKRANRGMGARQRQKSEVMAGLAGTKKTWFKFVLRREEDIAEVIALLKTAVIPGGRVLLMQGGRKRGNRTKPRPACRVGARNSVFSFPTGCKSDTGATSSV